MDDFERTNKLTIHGSTYFITTSVSGRELLRVEAEADDGTSRWAGEFPSKYVEGITHKTGSAKRFSVFVKMLLSGLAMGSDSVFVDLLTYADLELLKARRAGPGGARGDSSMSGGTGNGVRTGSNAVSTNTHNNKRYLILTYAAEYDRVHYPLPLAYVETPGREQLERTIVRLRQELSSRGHGLEGVSFGSGPVVEEASAALIAQLRK
ncbi:unnamed protein product, partial [Choristocarpus tenellus]